MPGTSTLSQEVDYTNLAMAVVTAASGVVNGATKDFTATLPQSASVIVDVVDAGVGAKTLTIVIQGSVDGATWTNILTPAAFTAAGTTILDLPLPAYPKYRATYTPAGTFTSGELAFVVKLVTCDGSHLPVTHVA